MEHRTGARTMTKKIMRYRSMSIISLASLLLVAGGFFWAYGALSAGNAWNGAAGPFILHFNNIQGITAVGGFGNLIAMGILGLLMVILNFFVATALEERDGVLGKIVAGATLVMAILLFLAFAAILNVN
jgi:hypothetical protein